MLLLYHTAYINSVELFIHSQLFLFALYFVLNFSFSSCRPIPLRQQLCTWIIIMVYLVFSFFFFNIRIIWECCSTASYFNEQLKSSLSFRLALILTYCLYNFNIFQIVFYAIKETQPYVLLFNTSILCWMCPPPHPNLWNPSWHDSADPHIDTYLLRIWDKRRNKLSLPINEMLNAVLHCLVYSWQQLEQIKTSTFITESTAAFGLSTYIMALAWLMEQHILT